MTVHSIQGTSSSPVSTTPRGFYPVRNLYSLNYMQINKSMSKFIIAETEYDLWYDSFLKIVLWFYVLIDVKDIRKKIKHFPSLLGSDQFSMHFSLSLNTSS